MWRLNFAVAGLLFVLAVHDAHGAFWVALDGAIAGWNFALGLQNLLKELRDA